ncbi:MAG TPA: FadR/GntR family transcriptional regulator [Methylomirabilota bacterium]|nr:FadR/GntR family transcriptional regulator [Methylomirabilota bacterium]
MYEHIVAQIERAIFEGRLQQGDKLPAERQLVREFGASRVAVREALRALEHRGLVEVRQGSAGGYFIREMDSGPVVRDFQTLFRLGHVSLAQLVEARALIEPESARLAALRANEADIKAVQAALDARAESGAPGRRRRSLDAEFHRLVAAAARNPVNGVVTHALTALQSNVVGPRADLTAEDDAAVVSAHRRIYEAIAGREPEAARAAMHAHIIDIEQRLGRTGVERAAS